MYIPRRLYIFGCVLKPEAVGEGVGGVSEQKVFRHKGIFKYRDIEQKWWKQKIKLMARTAGPAVTNFF